MSHSSGEVIVGGEVVAYFEYDGTHDFAISALWPTFEDMDEFWRNDVEFDCICGNEPQEALLYSHYGGGFYWPVQVCLHCGAIVSNKIPYDLPEGVELRHGDPLFRYTTEKEKAEELVKWAKRGYYLRRRYHFSDIAYSEPMLREALAIYDSLPDTTFRDTVTVLHHLATIAQQKGLHEEAEAFLWRMPHWIRCADGIKRLAEIRMFQGRIQDAEQLFKLSLAKVISEESPFFMVRPSLRDLGDFYFLQGRLQESEELFRRALALNPEHSKYQLRSLNAHLAVILTEAGRYTDAEEAYRNALVEPVGPLGCGADPGTVQVPELFAQLHQLGEPNHGEPFWLNGRFCGGAPSGKYPEQAVVLNNLANLRVLAGDVGNANRFYVRAIELLIEEMRADHPSVGLVRENLQRVVSAQDIVTEH